MKSIKSGALALMVLMSGSGTGSAELDVHEDFYAGFAQGAYYGLLLAGEDYDAAWCMRGELQFEAKGMGTGEAFQKTLEALLARCREQFPPQQSN